MGVIDEYLKTAGGKFLKADDVKEGDTLTIDKLWEDSKSWDSAYILIEGTFSQTNEERIARLGIQNIERIVDILSSDETRWIGNNLRVLGTATYPGLGQRGILWTGEKKIVQAPITAPTTAVPVTAPTTAAPVAASTPTAPVTTPVPTTTPLIEAPNLTGLTHHETIKWLKTYNVFANMEIPATIWDAISTDIKAELAMRRLITRKEGKPWLHQDAEKI